MVWARLSGVSGNSPRPRSAGADGGTRTHTSKAQGILSPRRLPFRHVRSGPVVIWPMPGCKRHCSALPVLTTSRSLRAGSRPAPFSPRPEPNHDRSGLPYGGTGGNSIPANAMPARSPGPTSCAQYSVGGWGAPTRTSPGRSCEFVAREWAGVAKPIAEAIGAPKITQSAFKRARISLPGLK